MILFCCITFDIVKLFDIHILHGVNMRNKRKGFTLAELLIVIAIVGVLAAISIPIFTNQLKKARLATNQANARQAENAVLTKWMTEDYKNGYCDGKLQDEVYYMYDPSTGEATNIDDIDKYSPDAIGVVYGENGHWDYVESDISKWTADTTVGKDSTLGSKVFNNTWFLTVSVDTSDNTFGKVTKYYVK